MNKRVRKIKYNTKIDLNEVRQNAIDKLKRIDDEPLTILHFTNVGGVSVAEEIEIKS